MSDDRQDQDPLKTTLEEVLREIEEAEEETPYDGEAGDALSPDEEAQEEADGDD